MEAGQDLRHDRPQISRPGWPDLQAAKKPGGWLGCLGTLATVACELLKYTLE